MKILDNLLKRFGYVKKENGARIFGTGSGFGSMLEDSGLTYKQLVDSYKSWVYTSIDKISKTIASIPLELFYYKVRGKKIGSGMQIKADISGIKNKAAIQSYLMKYDIEKIKVYEHPFISLMNSPNPVDTRSTLWISIVQRLELAGQCGVYMPRNGIGLPVQMIPLPMTSSGTLRVIPDPVTIIGGFEYIDGSKRTTFTREEILYLRYPNPGTPLYGLSPLMAQRYPYDIDLYLMQYLNSMLKNKSFFGNVFTTDQELDKPTIDEFREMLAEQFDSAQRSGRAIVTHTGMHLDNTKLGNSFKDMMIQEAATYAGDKIITSYGLTPGKLGFVKDVNRSTAEVLDKNFYDECIKPRCMLIEEYFEKDVLPLYDEGLMLDFDIPTITERDLDIAEREMNLRTGYTVINEERAKDGLPEVPWGDKPWLPFSVMQPGTSRPVPVDNPAKTKSVSKQWTPERKKAAVEKFLAHVSAWEKIFVAVMEEHFDEQKKYVLSQLSDNWKAIDSMVGGMYKQKRRTWLKQHKDRLDRINIDEVAEAARLKEKFQPIITSLIAEVANERLSEFDSLVQFNVEDKNVMQWIGKRLVESTGEIQRTTHDRIASILREGFSDGLSVTQMAEEVTGLFSEFKMSRALMIARTETVSASNYADIESVRQTGLDDKLLKFWLNEFDARDTHVQAGIDYDENSAIPINETFRVGQDTMIAPGNGTVAGENINCRCNLGFVKVE